MIIACIIDYQLSFMLVGIFFSIRYIIIAVLQELILSNNQFYIYKVKLKLRKLEFQIKDCESLVKHLINAGFDRIKEDKFYITLENIKLDVNISYDKFDEKIKIDRGVKAEDLHFDFYDKNKGMRDSLRYYFETTIDSNKFINELSYLEFRRDYLRSKVLAFTRISFDFLGYLCIVLISIYFKFTNITIFVIVVSYLLLTYKLRQNEKRTQKIHKTPPEEIKEKPGFNNYAGIK